jgi:S1-C subfamily serine protease
MGHITKSTDSLWFTSSIRGNSVGEPYGGDSIQLHAHQIQALWQQLSQGDVDRKRLFGDVPENEKERPYLIAAVDQGVAAQASHARERAIACTVGLRRKTGNRWSGVIISPDGWVATCAHGGKMPGDQVVVELPDGRSADAKVTGVNPITDIALIKIRDEGPWPFAELSDNSDVKIDTPCWFVFVTNATL